MTILYFIYSKGPFIIDNIGSINLTDLILFFKYIELIKLIKLIDILLYFFIKLLLS